MRTSGRPGWHARSFLGRVGVFVAVAIFAGLGAPNAFAQSTTSLFGFDWTLNGNAYVPSGTSTLRLTDAAGRDADAVGSAWVNQQVSTTNDIHAQFTIYLHDHTSDFQSGIGDGLTFTIQSSAAGTGAIGTFGGCLGYCGIAPSLAVEFDTWDNCCFDPNANHIGVLENGDETTYYGGAMDPGFAIYGEPVTAWVDYTASTHQLAVYASTSTTKPATPLITTTVDLSTVVDPSSAYVGFTAATGAADEVHDVTAFSLSATPGGVCGGPSTPEDVINQTLLPLDRADGVVSVAWNAPTSCDPIDHYNVINAATGSVVATVPASGASSYSATVSQLGLCTSYEFAVVAVGADGEISSIAFPASPAFTVAYPQSPPPVVTIIIQGVGSSVTGGSWNPLNTFYCTSDGDNSAIQRDTTLGDMAYHWLNVNDSGKADYATPGAGNNLIDSAASTGGIVLPLSYVKGTTLTGTARSPLFTVPSYGAQDVADTTPSVVATYLNTLITQINQVFPNAKIVVVGHSNGGLVAQQWWTRTKPVPGPQHGVVQVFSLDSPINGNYAGTLCVHPKPSEFFLCGLITDFGSLSNRLLSFYGNLWLNQSTNDPIWATLDAANHMWTPFITFNDPLYDSGDFGALPTGAAQTNIGFASQGLVGAGCASPSVHWQSPPCFIDTPPDAIDAFHYDDGTALPFGVPGDLWVHSVIKNNSAVIAAVMQYIR